MAKGEAALGHVELGRRHPQIEQHTVDVVDLPFGQGGSHVGEGRAHEYKTVISGCQRLRMALGVGILIEGDHTAARVELLQNRGAVPAPPERGIDVDTARAHGKCCQRGLEQHRLMFGGHGGGEPRRGGGG